MTCVKQLVVYKLALRLLLNRWHHFMWPISDEHSTKNLFSGDIDINSDDFSHCNADYITYSIVLN